jgi:streptomycin 6-kinase
MAIEMNIEISPTLVENHAETPGIKGNLWLDELPAIVADACDRWLLSAPGKPYPDAQYNYVVPTKMRDGKAVVLKIVASKPEFESESSALTLYKGEGAAKLIAVNRSTNSMLLEFLQPGSPLAELHDDDASTRVAARLMKKLWRPVKAGHPFRTVENWASKRSGLKTSVGKKQIPKSLMDRASNLLKEVTESPSEELLVHGDLHHWNIVQAKRAPYLAIDPKGLYGNPLYDVIAFLRNWPEWIVKDPDISMKMTRRVEILSEELGYDRKLIASWGVSGLTMDALQSLVENPDDDYASYQIQIAGLLVPSTL